MDRFAKNFSNNHIKNDIKGITLISLIVTIIVILLLTGITIGVSIGNEGIFTIMQQAKENFDDKVTRQEAKIEDLYKQIQSGAIGTITPGIEAIGGNKAYKENGKIAIVPQGFTVSGLESEQSIENGLVIYQTDGAEITDWETAKNTYNQWVWIPVNNVEDMYEYNADGVSITGNTGVTTKYYSKSSTLGNSSFARTTPGNTTEYREPDLIVGNGSESDSANYSTAGFSSITNMAENLVIDYAEMIESVEKYGGFYVGRYELTGTAENPTEKPGTPLTSINWYNAYNICKKFGINNENIETRMMWGTQWDKTCKFINTSGDKVNLDNSKSYGNYNDSTEPANVSGYGNGQITGYSNKWCTNNIYDLAGNLWEWTQESNNVNKRARRGGAHYQSGSTISVVYRSTDNSTEANGFLTTRPTLYLNPNISDEEMASYAERKVTGISLSETSKTMVAGNSASLTVSFIPSDISDSVTWSSSNSNVADVSNGTIIANSAGSATITATTSSGKTASCSVNVQAAVVNVNNNVYYASIQDGIDAINSGTVTLLTDLTTGQSISVASGKDIIFDMNSKSITPPINNTCINVSGAGSITIKNGTVTNNNSNTSWPAAIGVNNTGTVTLENMSCSVAGSSQCITKNGTGTLNISSGYYYTSSISYASIQFYGDGNHGTVNINGGSFPRAIQALEGATMVLNINGGEFTYSRSGYNTLIMGSRSTSTINITGGTFTANNCALGSERSATSCNATITGGTFNVTQLTNISNGTLRWRPSAISGSYGTPYADGGITEI